MKQIFHAYILNTEFNAADADMQHFISDVLGKEINPDDLSLEPDLIILEKRKERKNIIDADVEAAMRSLELKPFGDRKLLIISHSDLMTVRAQNRILKKLEEPSGDAVIALVTRTPDLMLDTIRSRCIEKRFDFKQNFSEEVEEIGKTIARHIENKEKGFIAFPDIEKAIDTDIQGVLSFMQQHFSKGISYENADIVLGIEAVKAGLFRGLNPKYAVKGMYLDMVMK